MIQALNFVRGAVATKDLVPVLTHVRVQNSRIQASNGRLTIDAPCPALAGFEFTVPCEPFLKAVDACNGEPTLSLSEDGSQLRIKHKSFKATLPLDTTAEFPSQEPEGEEGFALSGKIIPALRVLTPFISKDASRPWACGVLFRNGQAFATNNVILVSRPAVEFPQSINLPNFLVAEILRLGLEPTTIQASHCNITFSFANGSWLKSVLGNEDWPGVERMLEADSVEDVPAGMLQAVERILPFCPDDQAPVIELCSEGVRTMDGARCASVGGFSFKNGAFRAEPLIEVLKVATHADFSKHPQPAPFKGVDGLRGLLVSVRS